MNPFVFISYSHFPEDKNAVKRFTGRLREADIEYFLDEKDIPYGDIIHEKVLHSLKKATHVVAFLSPGSEQSQWVFFEIGMAYSHRKTIILRLLHSKQRIPSFLSVARYMNSEEDEENFIRELVSIQDPPDPLEVFITETVNLERFEAGTRTRWRPELVTILREYDGEDTSYIIWNKKKERLYKTYHYGVKWSKPTKLTIEDKIKVCDILNVPSEIVLLVSKASNRPSKR